MNLSVNRPAGLARIQLSNTSVAPLSREVFLTGISVLPFAANQYIPVCLRSQSFLHSFQSQRHDRVPLGLCWETPTSSRAFLALRQIRQLTHRRRSGRESRPRGFSPRGARRTGRDTLASSGSHQRATALHGPVGEQVRTATGDRRDPVSPGLFLSRSRPWLLTAAAERWFEVRSCRATSRGRPSSVKQLRTLRFCKLRVLMAHDYRLSYRFHALTRPMWHQ